MTRMYELFPYKVSFFQNNLVSEIHSIVSGAKALITWTTRDAIQECREACGGHGYLKDSGLGDLRNDQDPTVTYEGDNNVLQQQSSNWLLKQWSQLMVDRKTSSPLSTCQFLNYHLQIRNGRYRSHGGVKNLKGELRISHKYTDSLD